MPVTLATKESEIRKITVQSQPGQKELVEWLKAKALSSIPSTSKNK
jgi:hypothetical protein